MFIDSNQLNNTRSINQNLHYFFLFSVIFFCTLSFVNSGYHIFWYNQSIQIPLVYLLNNPELYANDPFAATLPFYASLLWQFVAKMANWVSLESTLLILFIFEKLLLIYAAAKLANSFQPNSNLAIISVMALLAIGITPIVGSGTVVADYLEQTAFSIPFFILAATAFHGSKYYQWAIWMAIGSLSNIMYGAYALTYFGLVFLIDKDYRVQWKSWLSGLIFYLILNLPTFFLTLSAIKRETADTTIWFDVVEKRFPHHLFPMEWQTLAYFKLAIFAALVLVIAAWQRRSFPRLSKHLMVWSAAAGIWIAFAFASAYSFEIPTFLVLHPGRATDIWYLLASIGLLSIISKVIDTSNNRLNIAVLLSGIVTFMIFWQPQLNLLMIVILALMVTVIFLGSKLLSINSIKRLAPFIVIITALVISSIHFHSRYNEIGNATDSLIVRPSGEESIIADWARDNSSIKSNFLVPPQWSFFRTLSQRPVFVTVKDASAILWDRAYAQTWVDRMQAVGFNLKSAEIGFSKMKAKTTESYQALTTIEIKQLTKKYQLKYWVRSIDSGLLDSGFPVVFQTNHYQVVDLERL